VILGVTMWSSVVRRRDGSAFVSDGATTVRLTPKPMRPTPRWAFIVAATAISTGALEIVATVAGAVLAASHILDGASRAAVLGFLSATYLLWAAGLRVNVIANWRLLEQTGTSTNLLSKVMFELARLRSSSLRAPRMASAAGYVATEMVKEAPYYAGAFGAAMLSDTITSTDALVFLAGTNVGAAAYEYGVARLSRTFLDRRSQRNA
jgi:hypothetical protein